MSTQGQQAAARCAQHAAQQGEITDGFNILDTLGVMSNAHSPAEYTTSGGLVTQSNLTNLLLCHARLCAQCRPLETVDIARICVEAITVEPNELAVSAVVLQHRFGNAIEQGKVATDVGLDIM